MPTGRAIRPTNKNRERRKKNDEKDVSGERKERRKKNKHMMESKTKGV